MKFHLNHDPANKTLTIPRAALQLSDLADVSDLILHTDSGCVLLLPDKMSVAQTLKTFQLLTAINAELGKRSVFRTSCRCVCWQRPALTRWKEISNAR